MLAIRLRRVGRTHDPHYRIVVAEHTAPVQGKFLAQVGHYHPKTKALVIDQTALTRWLAQGAKPSNSVARLALRQGIDHKQIQVTTKISQPKVKAQERAKAKLSPAPATSPAPPEPTSPESESAETEPSVEGVI